MEEVGMGIHEARHHRAAADVQVLGSWSRQDSHVLQRSNAGYATTAEDDRLHRRRLAVEDEAAFDQEGLGHTRIGFSNISDGRHSPPLNVRQLLWIAPPWRKMHHRPAHREIP
jgi:hypothetical protein